MAEVPGAARGDEIREARRHFPATTGRAYLNTAAVGLASRRLHDTYRDLVEAWTSAGFDFVQGERAAADARAVVAALMGAEAADVALIPSVSAAAGLVAAQFGPARTDENVVIGEREYSSNHFPWRQLTSKGYEVRQVPFRSGGLQPADVAGHVDAGTRLVAFSGVQTATGHRSDIPAISAVARAVGALVFVDGAQLVGALPVADDVRHVDVLAVTDHKFLLNAGRGIGYCYLSRRAQEEFVPVWAGWKAGAVPVESFFGPGMNLSTTASRFDTSVSWLAAIGHRSALTLLEDYGSDAVFARNRELAGALRTALAGAGWDPLELPEANRSTIVSVPLEGRDPQRLLAALADRRVVGSVRGGNLRLAV